MTKQTKKPLLVIRLCDGVHIIESTEGHTPNRRYQEEAVSFLGGLLKRQKPIPLGVREAGARTLLDIVGFRDPELITDLPEFSSGGVEWHPVVVSLDIYFLSGEGFLKHLRKKAQSHVVPLSGHPLEARLKPLLDAAWPPAE